MSDSFKHLTREQKIELIAAIEEKQKRDLMARPRFTPTSSQEPVIRSTALERYVFCANGWGKSTVLVNEVHWAATGVNTVTGTTTPVPAKICLLLDNPTKINDFLTEYRNWHIIKPEQLHKKGKPEISFITYDNGSTVTVLTHDVDPLRLEGTQWTHVFADEPCPRPVFISIFRGGRIKGRPLRALLAGTPITAAWLRTEVFEPWSKGELPHVECFRGTTEDNRANLETGYIERFASKLSEREKGIRLRGEFFDLEGLALAHLFRRTTHTIHKSELNWDKYYPVAISIDPHPSKAHHAVVLGADKDNQLFVLDEFAEKSVARTFIRSLIARGWFTNYRPVEIVYDSLGSGDTTSGEGFKSFGNVINEELAKHALGRARATSYAEKDDEEFISRIQDALLMPTTPNNFGLLVPKLRVLSHCTGTIGDIENAQWARSRLSDTNKPKLDITNKDYLSCLKYALATNLYFKKNKEAPYYVNKPVYGVSVTPKRSNARMVPSGRAKYFKSRG